MTETDLTHIIAAAIIGLNSPKSRELLTHSAQHAERVVTVGYA